MIDFRARIGIYATSFFILALSATANATQSNITILNGKQSLVDGGCVSAIPVANSLDCSYDASDPTGQGFNGWQGPTNAASYYQVGGSPYAQGMIGDSPVPGDPLKAQLDFTGTIDIEDNGTPCTIDDTIAGEIILAAGTRAFAGGPGQNGEETWGDGDIRFPITPTTVDSATANGQGGCDYEIASAGFPPRIQEAGGAQRLYPVDAEVDAVGFYVAPSPVGMANGSEGNAGAFVTVTVGPGWSCTDNVGGTGACEAGPSGGSNFGGSRAELETVLVSISTDGNGDITDGKIFANNESAVFMVQPLPFNGWDGPLLTFQGQCGNCKLARDDNYEVVAGAVDVDLNIGVNDSTSLVDPTFVSITVSPDQGAVDPLIINNSGPVANILARYTPVAGSGTVETFVYQVDDSTNPLATATVTITIVEDTVPVANDVTIILSTVGVDPSTVTGQFNGLTDNGNAAGNNGVVTTDGASVTGTDATDGTNLTYVPNATFFTGMDTFSYTITDDQNDIDTGTVTVDIADALPTASDETTITDENIPADTAISVSAGNGSIAQHTFSISSDAT